MNTHSNIDELLKNYLSLSTIKNAEERHKAYERVWEKNATHISSFGVSTGIENIREEFNTLFMRSPDLKVRFEDLKQTKNNISCTFIADGLGPEQIVGVDYFDITDDGLISKCVGFTTPLEDDAEISLLLENYETVYGIKDSVERLALMRKIWTEDAAHEKPFGTTKGVVNMNNEITKSHENGVYVSIRFESVRRTGNMISSTFILEGFRPEPVIGVDYFELTDEGLISKAIGFVDLQTTQYNPKRMIWS